MIKSSTSSELLRDSNFGSKIYWIYFILYLVTTYFILSKVEYFPDFYNYNNYIVSETALLRFTFEPFSGLLMSYISNAKQYYIVTWILSSFILFLVPIFLGKRYFIYSTFLLINPFSIIMFQTPRQFIAYSIFCFLIILNSKYKYFLLFLPLLFHTITGFFSFFFIFLLNFKKSLFSFFLIIGLFGLYFFTTYVYTFYSSDELQRGTGRLFLFLFFIIVIAFLSYKKKNINIIFLISILIFTLFSYQITPYAGRIIPFFIPIIVLFLMSSFNKKDSLFVIHGLMLSMLLMSLVVILIGGFGYG